MNDLLKFLNKNRKKLVPVDYESLINTSSQIEALKAEKDQKKKAAAVEAIKRNLNGLEAVAKTRHYASAEYTSPYADVKNRLILQEAVGIARKLLKEV